MLGQQYDEELGLHYNRHRYYNPGQGRYITQDPIGLMGGWNLYNYPLNPVTNIDPFGLDTLILSGGPTDGNPLGYSAMAFTKKGVYSYGTDTPRGGSVVSYLTDQAKRRSTIIRTIKTTPEQEQDMIDYINANYKVDRSDYGYVTHNCATMVIDAMDHAGVARDAIDAVLIPNRYDEFLQGTPAYLPSTVSMIATLSSDMPPVISPQNGAIPTNLTEFNQ